MRWTALLAVLLLCGPAAAGEAPLTPEAAGEVVDLVVATVGSTPITASEVALERRLREAARAVPAWADPDDLPSRLLWESQDALEALIFREVLRQQPATADVPPPGDRRTGQVVDALADALDDVGDGSGFSSFLRSWGLTRAELVERVREILRLDQALEIAIEGRVHIDEKKQRAYYEQNRDAMFGGRPYEEVAPLVASAVYALQFERTLQSWRSEIRARARIRYIAR